MEKIITESLLEQIRLMKYDRSKTLEEQESKNIKLLREDCVQSMAIIDPKTGKGAYIDSVTGKPCVPNKSNQLVNKSNQPVKKDNKIKPLWNDNIKEFVHPAYVEYIDVPKNLIYIKNSDNTFSLKYPSAEPNDKLSADSPEVIQKKKSLFPDEQFKKNIKDQTTGDKFRKWVHDNPKRLKKVEDALKNAGLKTSFDITGPFDNDVIKIAYKTVWKEYSEATMPKWSLKDLYKGYLDNLEDIDTNSDSQQIADYRKNPKSFDNSILFFLMKLDQAELDYMKNSKKEYKNDINWLEKYGPNVLSKVLDPRYVMKEHIYDGYFMFNKALEHRNKIKGKMMWTDEPKKYLKLEDLNNLGSISRSTAIDPSYIIAVYFVDQIQQYLARAIREGIYMEKNGSLKPKDFESWDEERQLEWQFHDLSGFGIGSEQLGELYDMVSALDQIVSYVYEHNYALLQQTPIREVSAGSKESNIKACSKWAYMSKPVKATNTEGEVSEQDGYFFYSMKDVCKNYGGLWLGGLTSMSTCCCVDLPVDKPTYPTVRATKYENRPGASGAIFSNTYTANIKINLIRSCERTTDIRNLTERASDQVRDCSSDYHCWLDLASIAALIIPGVGIVISALIDTANAIAYLVEAGLADSDSERNEALLGAGFSMLGAIMGGGATGAKYLTKGMSKEVQAFGKEYVTIVYDVYAKGGSKIESEQLRFELELTFDALAAKKGLTEAEKEIAKVYLRQVSSLNTAAFETYVKSVTTIQDKIGMANMRRIGSEKAFIEFLNKENGNVITALEKYTKSEAGKEALTELGLYVVLADVLPRIQQSVMRDASESGKIMGYNTPLNIMVANSGLDLKYVQQEFGSDGSAEDNKKLRAAWLKMWRPGMPITQFKAEEYLMKLQLKELGYPQGNIKPEFTTTKYSKYATNTLKNRLFSEWEKQSRELKALEKRKKERQKVRVVKDEDYAREKLFSNNIVVPKSVADRKDLSPLTTKETHTQKDLNFDDFKY